FAVVLSPPVGDRTGLRSGGVQFTQNLDVASVPVQLSREFEQVQPTAWTYTEIRTDGPVPRVDPGPGIVVASQVTLPADGRTYTLYYLYPLTEQEATLALVSRALLG